MEDMAFEDKFWQTELTRKIASDIIKIWDYLVKLSFMSNDYLLQNNDISVIVFIAEYLKKVCLYIL